MIFNITYDVSVNLAPATFKSAVASVAQFFQNLFSDPVTINITVGYGEVGGQSMPSGALGSNISFLNSYSYAQIKSAFAADSKGGDDVTAVSTLPATSPAPGGGTYWVPRAEAKALGLIGASGNLDGNVGFSNTVAFDYDNSNGITAGQYDFFGVAAHEFSEIMGRILLTGRTIGSTANSYVPYDLFHYSAPGVRDFVGTTPGYFSLDGGNTNLDNFNTNPSGDFGDWAASAGNDSFLAFSNAGVVNAVTAPDLRAMDILGWNRSAPTAATFLAQGDFNSDGKSDFTWRDANAQMSMWSVDALGNFAVTNLGTIGSSWTVLTADHFVNAGTSQMLTRSDPDGTMTLWWVAGGALTGINLGQHWSNISFVDHGNFVPSGQSDILVRNNIDNHMYVWWVDQNSSTLQGMDLGPYWANIQYKGHGDFNSDGTLDMLVRNVTDNHMYVWWVGANNALQGADLGAHWGNIDLVATGQFTSNGGTNMLVRNNVDNHMYDWWIDHNTNTLQGMDLGPYWANIQFLGSGNFMGDSKSEMLVRNAVDHHVYEWWIDQNSHTLQGGDLGPSDPNWLVQATGDYNGDGYTDLLWHNMADGRVVVEFNGTQLSQLPSQVVATVTGASATPPPSPPPSSDQTSGTVAYGPDDDDDHGIGGGTPVPVADAGTSPQTTSPQAASPQTTAPETTSPETTWPGAPTDDAGGGPNSPLHPSDLFFA
jgi:hypothetical protein